MVVTIATFPQILIAFGESIILKVSVTSNDVIKCYLGSSEVVFKKCYSHHTKSVDMKNMKHTELSKYIRTFKEKNREHELDGILHKRITLRLWYTSS